MTILAWNKQKEFLLYFKKKTKSQKEKNYIKLGNINIRVSQKFGIKVY